MFSAIWTRIPSSIELKILKNKKNLTSNPYVCWEMMMEMNPDVKGDFLNISVEDFIQNKLSDITGCQLVIACDLTVK